LKLNGTEVKSNGKSVFKKAKSGPDSFLSNLQAGSYTFEIL
jgi:hypothetical protein